MTNPMARFVLKLLGVDALRKYREQEATGASAVQSREAGGESVWLRAPEVGATPEVEADAGGAGDLPWQALPERRAGRSIWLYRALLVVLLGLPWAVGVAKMTHPAEAAAPVATAPSAPFPDAAASAVAERFAVSYLSWDHDAPTGRSSALAQDVPGLQDSDKFGWDGNGHQAAANATTITVAAQSATVATVTVTAVVTPYDAANAPAKQRTEALAVPVEVRAGRVVVTGQPASVAVPRPAGSSDTRANRDEDAALASSTAGYATSFFTAYATQDDVSAVAAPSAQIQGLSGIYALKDVRSWVVYAGSGATRDALATVEWKSGESTITQNYRLTLTQVTAGDSARWQVATLDAATN